MSSDLAYGYTVVKDIEADNNIEFLLTYLKKNYVALERASIESVDILHLQDDRVNYRIFLKSGLESWKFIIFYEEKFQRVIDIRSFSFQIGGKYTQNSLEDLVHDSYFRKIDQYIKEKYENVAEGSNVVSVESRDLGSKMSYRSIYAVAGKTYHLSALIHKETQVVEEEYWN